MKLDGGTTMTWEWRTFYSADFKDVWSIENESGILLKNSLDSVTAEEPDCGHEMLAEKRGSWIHL